jgi:HAMP domain-containing protein
MREQMTHKTVPLTREQILDIRDRDDFHLATSAFRKLCDMALESLAAAPQPQDSEPVSSMDYGQFIDEVTNPPQQAEIKRLTAEIERLNKENKNWQKVTIHQANEIERLEAALAARSQP